MATRICNKVFTAFFIIFLAAQVTARRCYTCQSTSGSSSSPCLGNMPKALLRTCPIGVNECYTVITNKFKYRRGCAHEFDYDFSLCMANLMEDCRICNFDKCNSFPIEMPIRNNCTQCTENCDTEIMPTSCGNFTQLQTEPSKCFFKFGADGKVMEKGCLTKDVHADVKEDEILLQCEQFGCNEVSPKTRYSCYMGSPATAEDCTTFTESHFPGCFSFYESVDDKAEYGCSTKLKPERFKLLLSYNNFNRSGSICYLMENADMCNKRSSFASVYVMECRSKERCMSFDGQCYYRYRNNRLMNIEEQGCVDEYTLGTYSNLTYLCHNSKGPSDDTSKCISLYGDHKHTCHKCTGNGCDDVAGNINSRSHCEGVDKVCYTYINMNDVVTRGCDSSLTCEASKERCRLCIGNYCNNDFAIRNPLWCPKTFQDLKTDALEKVVFEQCPGRTTTGILDLCCTIRVTDESSKANLTSDCYFQKIKRCRSDLVICDTAPTPRELPRLFKCIQCLDVNKEQECALHPEVKQSKKCAFVFGKSVRGCFSRYNPFTNGVERGCATDLDGFAYKRCLHPAFSDCEICNKDSCNTNVLPLDYRK